MTVVLTRPLSHNGPSGAFFFHWCCFCKAWVPCSCHYSYRCNCNSEKENDDDSPQSSTWRWHLHPCKKWDSPPSSNTCELFKYLMCTQSYSAVPEVIQRANLGAEPTLRKCMVRKCTVRCNWRNVISIAPSRAGSGCTKPWSNLCKRNYEWLKGDKYNECWEGQGCKLFIFY